MRRPPGLPPMKRQPVVAAMIALLLGGMLWFSLPGAWRLLTAAGWHWETVFVVLGAHAAILGPIGWIAWMFWAGRRPGDGG